MDKRKVICIIAVIAILFFSLLGILISGNIKTDSVACIYSGGKLVKTIDLSTAENQTFTVYSEGGGCNTIEIKDGTIGVINADCPDKICVHTAYISDGVQPIVCVPNRLVIRIEASRQENSHVD